MELKIDDGWVKVWEHGDQVGLIVRSQAAHTAAVTAFAGLAGYGHWCASIDKPSIKEAESWLRRRWNVPEEVTAEHVGRMVMVRDVATWVGPWELDSVRPDLGFPIIVKRHFDCGQSIQAWKHARLATEEEIARG